MVGQVKIDLAETSLLVLDGDLAASSGLVAATDVIRDLFVLCLLKSRL